MPVLAELPPSAASGDYLAVKNGVAADPSAGVCSWQSSGSWWPVPVSNTLTAIDDPGIQLSMGGTYYSATSPDDLQRASPPPCASLEGHHRRGGCHKTPQSQRHGKVTAKSSSQFPLGGMVGTSPPKSTSIPVRLSPRLTGPRAHCPLQPRARSAASRPVSSKLRVHQSNLSAAASRATSRSPSHLPPPRH